MSKHRLSPAPLPATKRQHINAKQLILSTPLLNFDSSLYDELVLVIFSHLSWTDLCAIQPTNRLWARLASDNQLWKKQFINEYGRLRLRGSRGFITRHEGRDVKPLPHAHKSEGGEGSKDNDQDNIDWKWMFRISSNWRRGRCDLEVLAEPTEGQIQVSALENSLHSCALLAGSLAVTTSVESMVSPPVYLHKRGSAPYALKGKHRECTTACITALSLDQSPPSIREHKLRLAVFYDSGEFTIFLIDHNQPQHSRHLLSYHPRGRSDRTTPIRQAVYHHPLLITLSHSFKLSIYDLSDDNVVHSQTLSSFSSFPPTSMVLTATPKSYRLVLAYSATVYPSHWGPAVTVLTISPPRAGLQDESRDSEDDSLSSCIVTATRSVRAFDVPSGWIDDAVLRTIRDQWGRRAARVADIQTDGKWVVLAPADKLPLPPSSSQISPRVGTTACALQLYRLHIPTVSGSSSSVNGPRMTFVRTLHGHTGPVISLALADGRCVSRGVDGSLWVWDLERGWGIEVQTTHPPIQPLLSTSYTDVKPSNTEASSVQANPNADGLDDSSDLSTGAPFGAIVFNERKILTADAYGVEMRKFDI